MYVSQNSHKVCFKKTGIRYYVLRAVGRSENPGLPVLFGGHNLPLLVEIGLTDLPKFAFESNVGDAFQTDGIM